ncbi:MAG: arginase family protein [Candidatus Aenigmarchaeota archaeon]|nr:arginase family protein [Candidatus Aenigmarchaeota archaeon]
MLYTSNTFVEYNYPLAEADAVFLGIPFVSTSISRPARFGPVIVREALKLMSGSHNGRDIFSHYKFCDLGDLDVVEGSYEKTAERIRDTVAEIQNAKVFPVFIGGEHSITLPIAEALKAKTIIQFDSHGDMLSHYKGNEFSHGTWAFHASRNAKLVQIGVRVLEEEERKNAESGSVLDVKTPEQLSQAKIERPVHLTVDMDVFNPAYVETGFPEGKMEPKEFFEFLKHINPDSMDIVEIADDRLTSKSGWLAAEIIKNVLGRKFMS